MITPDTKVGDLLRDRPDLEPVLVGLSPAYRALANPVLRRTVARVATLRQVARVGNVPLGALIAALREASGESAAAIDETVAVEARPDWASEPYVTGRWDARATIEEGGHPLERVMKDLACLRAGGVYELVTPFYPAPLVEIARGKGYLAFGQQGDDGVTHTFFRLPR